MVKLVRKYLLYPVGKVYYLSSSGWKHFESLRERKDAMLSTQRVMRVSVCFGVCALCAMAVSQAGATTTLGSNFDGTMQITTTVIA